MYMGDNNKNDRVASPESVSIYLKEGPQYKIFTCCKKLLWYCQLNSPKSGAWATLLFSFLCPCNNSHEALRVAPVPLSVCPFVTLYDIEFV